MQWDPPPEPENFAEESVDVDAASYELESLGIVLPDTRMSS